MSTKNFIRSNKARAIVVSLLRFTDTDYPFGIFRLILTYQVLHWPTRH